MDLSLTATSTGSRTVLEVRGEVDVHSAPQLAQRLSEIVGAGQESVVVDLSWLSFIDSTGLGALVAARNQAEEVGAAFRLVCRSERVLKLFRITGLDSVFDIHATVASALAAG